MTNEAANEWLRDGGGPFPQGGGRSFCGVVRRRRSFQPSVSVAARRVQQPATPDATTTPRCARCAGPASLIPSSGQRWRRCPDPSTPHLGGAVRVALAAPVGGGQPARRDDLAPQRTIHTYMHDALSERGSEGESPQAARHHDAVSANLEPQRRVRVAVRAVQARGPDEERERALGRDVAAAPVVARAARERPLDQPRPRRRSAAAARRRRPEHGARYGGLAEERRAHAVFFTVTCFGGPVQRWQRV